MSGRRIYSLPAAEAGAAPVSSATAWAFGSAVTLSASLPTNIYVIGLQFQNTDIPAIDVNQDILFEVTVGGTTKLQIPFNMKADTLVGYNQTSTAGIQAFYLPEPFVIPAGSAVAVKVTDSIAAALTYDGVKLLYEKPAFDDARQTIINGLDSAQSEATGWDAVVKAGLAVGAVVRTSDTVVTITVSAFASYDITAQETITVTVPASAVAGAAAITATPTFTVDTAGGFTGTGSEAMAMSLAGTGQQQHSGTGTAAILFALAGVGMVLNPISGTGSMAMGFGLSGTAQQQHSGTGSVAMAFGEAGTAQQQHTGTGGVTISWSLAGTGEVTEPGGGFTGTGAVDISFSLSGTGTTTEPEGTISPPGGGSGHGKGTRVAYRWREKEKPAPPVEEPAASEPKPSLLRNIGTPAYVPTPPEVRPWEPAGPITPALESVAPLLDLPAPPPEDDDDDDAITALLGEL